MTKHPKTAEYGSFDSALMGRTAVIATSGKYELVHKTAGYYCAGSLARWDNESYGVRFFCNYSNAWHGRSFKTLFEAHELFDKWSSK